MSDQDERRPTLTREAIEQANYAIGFLTRGGVAIVGVCYVAGLLIVNIYLGRFGVAQLGFIETQYIMAGAVWLVLAGWVSLFVVVGWFTLRDTVRALVGRPFSGTKIAGALFDFVVGIVLVGTFVAMVLWQVTDNRLQFWSAPFLETVLTLALSGFGFYCALLGIRVGAKHLAGIPQARGWILGPVLPPLGFTFLTFLPLYQALATYSEIVYPHVSQRFGGGRSQRVLLSLSVDASEIGLHSHSSGAHSVGPLELISETAEGIVVLPQSDSAEDFARTPNAMWIPKRYVRSIAYVSAPGPLNTILVGKPTPLSPTPSSTLTPEPTAFPTPTASPNPPASPTDAVTVSLRN